MSNRTEELLRNGKPGAERITQMTLLEGLVEWWVPTIADIPIGEKGKTIKYETFDVAYQRAIEIQTDYRAKQLPPNKKNPGEREW